MYADVCITCNTLDLAISNLSFAIQNLPHNDAQSIGQCLLKRAHIYEKIGRIYDALSDYSKAIKTCPNDSQFLIERAQYYSKHKKFQESDNDFNQALSYDPSNPTAKLGIGYNMILREEYKQAVSFLDEYISENRLPESYALRAEAHLKMGENDKAIDDLFSSIECGLNNQAIELLKKQVYSKQKGLIIRKLKDKVNSDASNSVWSYVLSLMYEELGLIEYALTHIDEAIKIDNRDNKYYSLRARLSYYNGDIQAALRDEVMSTQYDGSDTEYIHLFQQGLYQELLGDTKGAIVSYTKSLKIRPGFSKCLVARGRTYKAKGLTDSAKSDLKHSADMEMKNRIYEVSHYAYFYLGDNTSAIRTINQILKTQPTPETFFDASCLYSLMGDKSSSIQYLKKALEAGYLNAANVKFNPYLNNTREQQEYIDLFNEYFENNNSIVELTPIIDSKAEKNHETKQVKNSSKNQENTTSEKKADESQQKKEPSVKKNDNDSSNQESISTLKIPYKNAYGVMRVNGVLNGIKFTFNFVNDDIKVQISSSHAEHLLEIGYIRKSDITYADGSKDESKIPENSTITIKSLKIGEFSLNNVQALVVSDNHMAFEIGTGIFPNFKGAEIANGVIKIKYKRIH